MLANHIIYILATGSLMAGSILDFNKDDLPSYFFVAGSSLFFIKSTLSLILYRRNINKNTAYNII